MRQGILRAPMPAITLFHNPRCSKSREALRLLEEHGAEVVVVRYLETPPDEETLREVLRKLGARPKDVVRRGEAAFAALGLAASLEDDDAVLRAILSEPILLERPIAVLRDQARIGRPPERILELL